MSEASPSPAQLPLDAEAAGQLKPRSSAVWVVTVALLSLLFPGLGQVCNRQPWKGLGMAIMNSLLVLAFADTRFISSVRGLVTFLLIALGLTLFIIGDAAYVAWKRPRPKGAFGDSWLKTSVFTGLILLAGSFPSRGQILRGHSYLGAFKVSSSAMCPTICEGERIVADKNAYRTKTPQRGEVILFEHEPGQTIFVKRVVGVGGDTVEPDPDGRIFVNGNVASLPPTCGNPVLPQAMAREMPDFPVTKVPEGSFFVVGDNLSNSNDSRIPGFGLVSADHLRGKPLYLYWSPGHSRIGCRMQ